jgi:hypothetical protein
MKNIGGAGFKEISPVGVECLKCGCLIPKIDIVGHVCEAGDLLRKATKGLEIKKEIKVEKPIETDLVIKDMSKELAESMSLGDVFVKSGMFPDLKSQAQAVVKILAGRELGVSPLQSITDIYIVNGKVATSAKLIASLIKRSGKYDYSVDKLDNEGCSITFYQLNGKKEKIGENSFTKQDAILAGLINKQSYKSYPKDMFFARALSAGGRRFCPDVVTAYTVEELSPTKDKNETIGVENENRKSE